MTTIENSTKDQKIILFEYLERTLGPFQHNRTYYDQVLALLANEFYSGLFSSDDVSWLVEELFLQANQKSNTAMRELPDEFFLLMELEWDIRNKPERAVHY